MDGAEFLLSMKDALSAPAANARSAAAQMQAQLKSLEAQQRLAGGGSIALNDAIRKQKASIDELKSAMPGLISTEAAAAAAAKASSAARKAAAGDAKAASREEAAAAKQAKVEASAAAKAAEAEIKAAAKAEAAAVREAKKAEEEATKSAAKEAKKAAQEAKKASDVRAAELAKVGESVGAAGGPLASLVEKFDGLGKAASTSSGQMALVVSAAAAVAAALLAVAVAAVAASVAFGALVAKMAHFALVTSDGKETYRRQLDVMAGGAKVGAELSEAIDRVKSASSRANEEVEGWGKSLANAGLRGKLFEETLQSMSDIAATMGPEVAGRLQDIVEKSKALGHFEVKAKNLKGMGIEMADLAKAMNMSVKDMEAAMKNGKVTTEAGVEAMNKALRGKLGGAAAAEAGSFTAQMLKFKDSIADLFEDINIKPFLEGLKSVLGIFKQGTSTASAMGVMIRGAFGAIFSVAGAVLPYVAGFLKGMVIGALQFYIAAKQVAKELGLVGGSGKSLITMKDAIEAGKTAFKVLLVVVLAVAAVLGVVLAVGIALGGVLAQMALRVYSEFQLVKLQVQSWIGVFMAVKAGATAAFSGIVAKIKGAFAGLSLAGIASNLATSFISAIKGSIGKVVAAMTALGGAAMSALKSVLGIASPSKVMLEYGGHTATGFAQGIERGTDKAAKAGDKLGAAVQPGGPAAAAGKGGGLHIEHLHWHGTAEDYPRFRAMLSQAFDGEINAGPEPATA